MSAEFALRRPSSCASACHGASVRSASCGPRTPRKARRVGGQSEDYANKQKLVYTSRGIVAQRALSSHTDKSNENMCNACFNANVPVEGNGLRVPSADKKDTVLTAILKALNVMFSSLNEVYTNLISATKVLGGTLVTV